MNLRMTIVLTVMTLAVLAALFPALPDEPVLVAATQDESSGVAATQDESSGAAAARAGWR